jgi:hypothetical protein
MAETRAVSNDPGGVYLAGLGAELMAAIGIEKAWEESLGKALAGVLWWQDEISEMGCRNADRYRDCVTRLTVQQRIAVQRTAAARDAIREQQEENGRDYRERVALGLNVPMPAPLPRDL